MHMRLLTILVALCCAGCGRPTDPSQGRPTNQSQGTPGTNKTSGAEGIVVESGGGGRVEGASVAAVDSCNYTLDLAETQTDAMGSFRLEFDSSLVPSRCSVYLRAKKEGYVQNTVPLVTGVSNTIMIQRLRQVTGIATEVDGGPAAGVRVRSSATGPSTYTDSSGSFVLAGVGNYLTLSGDAFVERLVDVPAGADADLGTVYIQRRIVLSAGSRVTTGISSRDVAADLTWLWGDPPAWCSPCKEIDLETGQQDLEIQLEWSSAVRLELWAGAYSPVQVALRAAAGAGSSALTLRVPAATRFLLVGLPSDTSVPSPPKLSEPLTFTLTAAPQ